jgi:hypothetical protein
VSRIALVKPDKARNVESMILAAAQRGQLTERASGRGAPAHCSGDRLLAGRVPHAAREPPGAAAAQHHRPPAPHAQVSEERLVAMLGQLSEKEGTKAKITIQRRRPVFDEDD